MKEARKWVQKNWPISHSTKAQTTVLEHRLDTAPELSFKSGISINPKIKQIVCRIFEITPFVYKARALISCNDREQKVSLKNEKANGLHDLCPIITLMQVILNQLGL